jgi:hypothetical protein
MEEVWNMDKDFVISYDTTYDERGWDDDYEDEDVDYEAEEADWRLDDEREMYRD